jgi:hypothetical protein
MSVRTFVRTRVHPIGYVGYSSANKQSPKSKDASKVIHDPKRVPVRVSVEIFKTCFLESQGQEVLLSFKSTRIWAIRLMTDMVTRIDEALFGPISLKMYLTSV